ncbi:hypothetical protein DFQ26_001981 [Actinomortierella ambigua]|nr:hypothetical protein DFQ26_001981 [Actinomortierella ambigua]
MDIEDLGHCVKKPKVTHYNPCTVRNLRPGQIKEWCTCGLTKKGPWCDGKSHKGTTFEPLRWRVPDHKQTLYLICDCRYTTMPPHCDGIHYDLPLRYLNQIKNCPKQPHDPTVTKLCEECGWAAPREMWPEIQESDSDMSSSESEDETKTPPKETKKDEGVNKSEAPAATTSTAAAEDAAYKMEVEIDDGRPITSNSHEGTPSTNGNTIEDQFSQMHMDA